MTGPVDLDAIKRHIGVVTRPEIRALVAEVKALREENARLRDPGDNGLAFMLGRERDEARGEVEALRGHNEELREEAHTRGEAEKGWRDAYEALRGENERLRAALREAHGHLVGIGTPVLGDRLDIAEARRVVYDAAYGARDALGGEADGIDMHWHGERAEDEA